MATIDGHPIDVPPAVAASSAASAAVGMRGVEEQETVGGAKRGRLATAQGKDLSFLCSKPLQTDPIGRKQ
jgi:hypothetical protein